jgi:dTDP-4-amino-4,6-dideoxygalactose transaminase
VRAGDEVILPSLTFAATAAAIVQCGAVPVFAELAGLHEPWLSAAAAQAATGPRTRAIVTVAYAGHAGEAIALRALADAHGLALIEDAAHAVGARAGDRAVGAIGHAGAFSFFANKNLPLGEGGMLVTDDEELAARARRLRSHGMTTDTWARHRGDEVGYDVVEPGFNYRLDEPRAALGSLLLRRLAADNERRARLAEGYAHGLSSVAGARAVLALGPAAAGCAWHLFPILLAEGVDRGAFRELLRDGGIQTSVHYPPLHLTTAFGAGRPTALPLTESYGRRTVTLPLFPHMTGEQQSTVLEQAAFALARLTEP